MKITKSLLAAVLTASLAIPVFAQGTEPPQPYAKSQKAPQQKRHLSYEQRMAEVETLYPQEIAKIRELLKTNEAAAKTQFEAVEAKYKAQMSADNKKFRDLEAKYKKDKDQAAYAEIKTILEKRYNAKIAGIKARIAELKEQADILKAAKKDTSAMDREIASQEKFASLTLDQFVENELKKFDRQQSRSEKAHNNSRRGKRAK